MRRAVVVVAAIAAGMLAWSFIVRAQGETHRVYLPVVRREATSTPTSTPLPAPRPTRTPRPGCTELVSDGSFELGGGEWTTEDPSHAVVVQQNDVMTPLDGQKVLAFHPHARSFTVANHPTDSIVDPATIVSMVLSFSVFQVTRSSAGGADEFAAWVGTVENSAIIRDTVFSERNDPATARTWRTHEVDVRPAIARRGWTYIWFGFRASSGEEANTEWYLDVVGLELCVEP